MTSLRAHTDTCASPRAMAEPTATDFPPNACTLCVEIMPPPAVRVSTPLATYTCALPISPPALMVRPPPPPYRVLTPLTVFDPSTQLSAVAAEILETFWPALIVTSPPPRAPTFQSKAA